LKSSILIESVKNDQLRSASMTILAFGTSPIVENSFKNKITTYL